MFSKEEVQLVKEFIEYLKGKKAFKRYPLLVERVLDKLRMRIVMDTSLKEEFFSRGKVTKDFVLNALSDTENLLKGNDVDMKYTGKSYLNAMNVAVSYMNNNLSEEDL